jgi:hypothetical protein
MGIFMMPLTIKTERVYAREYSVANMFNPKKTTRLSGAYTIMYIIMITKNVFFELFF